MDYNWKTILVSPEASIKDVLKVVDKGGVQLALVTDNKGHLLGTVTDGDIRRALINDLPLNTAVSEIMFSSPTTVTANVSKKKVLALLESQGLKSIPVVEGTKVVGLETTQTASDKVKYDNPVFLMAGGFGTRLKPLTNNCPKPLLKLGDKPILETVLLSFIRYGFHHFYISTHYLPEMIQDYFGNGEKWGVTITYIHEKTPLGTGGALGLLPDELPDLPLIVMNGDILTKINLEKMLSFHNENNASATICVREYEYQIPFGVITNNGLEITKMVEKPTQHFYINAGIYVINPNIIRDVERNTYIDMPTLIERYIGDSVMMFPFYEYWMDIGRTGDYNQAQIDICTLEFE